jgi:hypothetical protein
VRTEKRVLNLLPVQIAELTIIQNISQGVNTKGIGELIINYILKGVKDGNEKSNEEVTSRTSD